MSSLQEAAAWVEAFLMVNDSDKNPQQKQHAEQIQAAKMAKDQLKALGDLAAELNQKASIPFRVYARPGRERRRGPPKVVIFQSGQVENPRPAGRRRTSKGNKAKGRAAPETPMS